MQYKSADNGGAVHICGGGFSGGERRKGRQQQNEGCDQGKPDERRVHDGA